MSLKGITPELYSSLDKVRNKKVGDLMEPPIVADVNSPISKIIGILTEQKVYDVFIKKKNTVTSINIRNLLSVRGDIISSKASRLTRGIPNLSKKESNVGYAARIMSHYRIRALPILQDNDIIGQISAKGIVKAIYEDVFKTRKIKNIVSPADIMTPNPIVITPKDKVSTARGVMIRKRIDHLPIIDEQDKLVGVLTSAHIAGNIPPTGRIGRRSRGIDRKSIRFDISAMGLADHDNAITISSVDESLRSITGLMIDKNSTYSILTNMNKVQGIITYKDIVALLGEKIKEDIPAYIIGLPEDPVAASLANSKFIQLIKLLRKAYPEIQEAECHIKLRNSEGKRKRYEVYVNIITPNKKYTYTDSGLNIATIFDQISNSLKKKFAHRPSEKQKKSERHITKEN
jgi:predicted transcriptional regulator